MDRELYYFIKGLNTNHKNKKTNEIQKELLILLEQYYNYKYTNKCLFVRWFTSINLADFIKWLKSITK